MSFTCGPRRRFCRKPSGRLRGRKPDIKGGIAGQPRASGGGRGVPGFTPLDLRRLLLLLVGAEAARCAGSASGREVVWLRLGLRMLILAVEREARESGCGSPEECVDPAVDGRVASPRGESF